MYHEALQVTFCLAYVIFEEYDENENLQLRKSNLLPKTI